ncbi:PREDICTED: uncharacterized protein LOC108377345 [Rhagoletis zephyria]|uniref:uncharacterized protein LOC108377345 n=1 Tax=Rhagoletis zephyria TaxID=28612 RepID=UPI0008117B4B|nr:PREDICTED: uncharacterized protein LOC108377345 [Rhagoletis zephyria]
MTCSGVSWQDLKHLSDSCFVPVLKQDLDDVPLQSDHFNEYRNVLELQLPILYDLLQQKQEWIFGSDEPEACETLANLLVLLCEVTAQNTIYGLSHESIERNGNRVLREHIPLQRMVVERIIFEFYQKKLRKDVWKRQLGSIHGFLRFLQLQYSGQMLPKQWVHFCLSVGLTVRESHDPTCKKIGVLIFQLILNSGDFSHLQKQNIHSVIYDSAYKDVDFLDSVEAATDTWNCLYTCLRFFEDLDSFNWSQLDDLMEKALKNITMASNNLVSLCHLQFVIKFGAYFVINQNDILYHCEADLNDPNTLEQCRAICATNNSYTIFRWAKDILNMFNVNSYKLMQDKEISQKFLLELHKCYLVCILPIKLEIIGPHLITFMEKFTSVLMEAINAHRMDIEIIKLTRATLETFALQLHHYPDSLDNKDFAKLHKALDKLLKQNIFVQNK